MSDALAPEFAEVVAGLPALPCDSGTDHAAGRYGHVPEEDAAYVIEFVHVVFDVAAQQCVSARFLICRGGAIHVRGRAEEGAVCPDCGVVGRLGDFVRIVGPIDVAPTP